MTASTGGMHVRAGLQTIGIDHANRSAVKRRPGRVRPARYRPRGVSGARPQTRDGMIPNRRKPANARLTSGSVTPTD